MKKILTTLLMFFCITTVFSQYDYIHDVYSAKDMNIKGKIKKITETLVYTDENGKVDNKEAKWKFVFEFDKNGNIINRRDTKNESDYIQYKYQYENGKLSKYTIEGNHYELEKYKFNYYTSGGSVETPLGLESYSLSNDKVSEVIYYYRDRKRLKDKRKYEYNSFGQITKDSYIYGYNRCGYTIFKTYEYNKQGDKIKQVDEFNDNISPDIATYEYEYDSIMNWTKCKEEKSESNLRDLFREDPQWALPTYTFNLRTRVYEFY